MVLARVIGSVVATQKHDTYEGGKLLLVQPLSLKGAREGKTLLAVDTVGAGAGETVIVVVEGRSACQAMRTSEAPVNAAIVGIADEIDWGH